MEETGGFSVDAIAVMVKEDMEEGAEEKTECVEKGQRGNGKIKCAEKRNFDSGNYCGEVGAFKGGDNSGGEIGRKEIGKRH